MTKPPELFAYERPIRSDFARQPMGIPYAARRVLTLLVLVALVGGGGYWFWHRTPSAPGEIPTIKADANYKQRPDQPGGIDIAHQDVQVYHEIDGTAENGNAKPTPEHMLPPPEEPSASAMATIPAKRPIDIGAPRVESLNPPPVATTVTPVPSSNAAPVQVQQQAAVAVSPQPAPAVATTIVQAAPVVVNPLAVVHTQMAPVQSAPVQQAAVEDVAPVRKKGGTVVQVAALPDEAAAQAMAQKLQMKYGSVLGGVKLHTVRADLGSKGIFYRIQSAQVTPQQAQTICSAVKNMNGGCILVRQ